MISGIRKFLDPVIINNKYIYLDFWFIPHVLSGILIFVIICEFFNKLKTSYKFLALFGILLAWEIFEIVAYYFFNSSLTYFGLADVFWDMVIGMSGGLLYHYLRKKVFLQ